MLRNIWRSRSISLKTKIILLCIFNTNVKSVLLYASETWRMTKALKDKLQTSVNKKLRYITVTGIWCPKKVSNEELRRKTDQEPIIVTIKRRKWQWIGHTLRKESSITKEAFEWNPQGQRKKGRPKQSWRRTIQEELHQIGMSWNEAKRTAHNRVRWRATVEALCSTWNEKE